MATLPATGTPSAASTIAFGPTLGGWIGVFILTTTRMLSGTLVLPSGGLTVSIAGPSVRVPVPVVNENE